MGNELLDLCMSDKDMQKSSGWTEMHVGVLQQARCSNLYSTVNSDTVTDPAQDDASSGFPK